MDNDKDRSYTIAADMWSLGVLTISLLTGSDIANLSPEALVTLYGSQDDSYTKQRLEDISARTLKFVQKLLVLNPEARMTADQALDHSWYTKPPREAAALNEAIEKISRFWMKRVTEEEVLEGICGVKISPEQTTNPLTPKFRKRVPDTSMSPYFNLDRHLAPRAPSTRKRLLDDLSQSGSTFVHTKMPRVGRFATPSGRRISIESVRGNDIFGQVLIDTDADEVDMVPDTPRTENKYGFSFSDAVDAPTSPHRVPDNSPNSLTTRKGRQYVEPKGPSRYTTGQKIEG
jgi:serine/threonine protein kinase